VKDCYWSVFNRREGVIKSFEIKTSSAKTKARADAWRKKHRPRGTRLVTFCIPPR